MHERVEAERQRQLWLRALGLPCWVARETLPGAAGTPALTVPLSVPPVRSAPAPVADSRPTGAIPPDSIPQSSEKPVDIRPSEEPSANVSPFTLRAFHVTRHWLIVQQSTARGGYFSREEGQLLDKLLGLWTLKEADTRALLFSPAIERNPVLLLQGFLQALAEKNSRMLLLIEEPVNQILAGTPRYQPRQLAGADILVVSSLREMLAAPQEHKRRSWDAMRQAGFNA